MKVMTILGTASVIALGSTATADVTGIEIVNIGDTGNGTTYHMYLNVTEGSRVDAIFGNSMGTMHIGLAAGMSFYQNIYGSALSTGNNPAFYPLAPSLEWDSFVTIGALDSWGTPFAENALLDIGIDFSGFDPGGGAPGGSFTTDNGSWFVTPVDDQGNPINGQVLIGQFTVIGASGDGYADLVGQVNVQGSDDGGTYQNIGVNWIPAPGALALLGFAGLAGRRRRR